ncbi:hypothetical protein SAMN05421863_109014 [Nitrosomonas communis]|uniref:Uncharacterized protein n=1 Tax=Nitrosomonas communis TaxID=44574 RepID=A0A1I4VTW8_9PROT|nr:hypothetical protein SAMN05421863_109014 [Nitrosomonas communis]
MPSIGTGSFDILPFVERRVVHDDHASEQELGQNVLRHPKPAKKSGVSSSKKLKAMNAKAASAFALMKVALLTTCRARMAMRLWVTQAFL